ncbi:MAG: GNAT family N-acetyltransferase [Candidatus Limnocylindria bacterium]
MRDATPDDAAAIRRVQVDTWRVAYLHLLPAEVLDSLSYDDSMWRRILSERRADGAVFVIERDRHVIGFVSVGPERTADPVHRGEIYAIYVLPGHQRKGIGRELMRRGAEALAARGIGSLLLWVLRENAAGRAFYERLGGRRLREKQERLHGVEVVEVAYGWEDTAPLRASRSAALPRRP